MSQREEGVGAPDQSISDDMSALRLPESDVYHYTRDGETTVCDMVDSEKIEAAQEANIEEAEKFFRLCSTCEQTYHPNFGMTTGEIRQDIRAEIGTPENDGTFNVRELMVLHLVVVQDDNPSLDTLLG